MTAERRTILALFSIAFGLRILYAVLVGTQPDINPNPVTPSVLSAREIASGFEWVKEPFSPRAPGYPVLLAGAFLVSGGRLWAGIILQAVLGALTVILVYRLGERLGNRLLGIIAAIWLSFYFHHIHFASLLLRDIFACLLLVLLLLLLSRPFHKMRFAIILGLAYTALVHVDPQYFILFPAIALFLLVWKTKHALLNIQYFFLFAGCLLVLTLPWTIRNNIIYGQPIPVGLESVNYIRPLIEGKNEKEKVSTRDLVNNQRVSRIDWYGSHAIEFWRFARLKGEKTKSGSDVGGRNPGQAWSLRHNLISILSYGLLLPFFIIGIIVSVRERNRTGLIITAVVFIYFLMRTYFGGNERARLPVEPFIILLAFYGLFYIIYALRKKPTAS